MCRRPYPPKRAAQQASHGFPACGTGYGLRATGSATRSYRRRKTLRFRGWPSSTWGPSSRYSLTHSYVRLGWTRAPTLENHGKNPQVFSDASNHGKYPIILLWLNQGLRIHIEHFLSFIVATLRGGLTHHGQGTHQYGCSYLVDKLIAWMCMYLFHTHLLISLPSTTKAFFKLLSQGGVFLSLFYFYFFCQFCDGHIGWAYIYACTA